jgi:octaprenyl-diphosphate synthase
MPVRKPISSLDMETPDGESAEFLAPVKEELRQVRNRFREHLMTSHDGINRQIETIGAGRGKMLRPALLLLSGLACGTLRREHIELAAMVELVHTATLLHDDVIDHAETRRNQPTANCLWGNTAAVLLGDFLLSRAFLAGGELDFPVAAKLLSQTAQQICQGELLQNLRRADWTMNQDDYMEIIEAKTAALFSTACRLGAIASGADAPTIEKFAGYGRCIGLAFQITDDILDITGDDKEIGKTLGTDAAQKKPTLPLIHCLGRQDPNQREILLDTFSGEPEPTKLVQILNSGGSLDYVRGVARQLAAEAAGSLLGQGTAVESLRKIALAVGNRV